MSDTEKNNGTEDVVVEDTPIIEADVEEGEGQVETLSGTASKTINEAIKQVENIGKALGSALQDRANVVMVRVNNDSLRYLDMLVEADVTKSRSESAAFLITEGIKKNEILFNKIREITDQISALRSQLRDAVDLEEEQ